MFFPTTSFPYIFIVFRTELDPSTDEHSYYMYLMLY